jgi:L-aspartate oxidase
MTGMHGANRLASNSLLEAVATAHFAAQVSEVRSVDRLIKSRGGVQQNEQAKPLKRREQVLLDHDRNELLSLMWDYVGVVRSDYRLQRAKNRVGALVSDAEDYYQTRPLSYEIIELRTLSTVAKLIIEFAITRKESRGLHYNVDHPTVNDRMWLKELVLKEGQWR